MPENIQAPIRVSPAPVVESTGSSPYQPRVGNPAPPGVPGDGSAMLSESQQRVMKGVTAQPGQRFIPQEADTRRSSEFGGQFEDQVTKDFEGSKIGRTAQDLITERFYKITQQCLDEHGLRDGTDMLDRVIVQLTKRMYGMEHADILTLSNLKDPTFMKLQNLSWQEIRGLMYTLETLETMQESLIGVKRKNPYLEGSDLGDYAKAFILQEGDKTRQILAKFDKNYEQTDQWTPETGKQSHTIQEFLSHSAEDRKVETYKTSVALRAYRGYLTNAPRIDYYKLGQDDPKILERAQQLLDGPLKGKTVRAAMIEAGEAMLREQCGDTVLAAERMKVERGWYVNPETGQMTRADIDTFQKTAVAAAQRKESASPDAAAEKARVKTGFETARRSKADADGKLLALQADKTRLTPAYLEQLRDDASSFQKEYDKIVADPARNADRLLIDPARQKFTDAKAKWEEEDKQFRAIDKLITDATEAKAKADDVFATAEKDLKAVGESKLEESFRTAIIELNAIVENPAVLAGNLYRLQFETLPVTGDFSQAVEAWRTMMGLGKPFDQAMGKGNSGLYAFFIREYGIQGIPVVELQSALQKDSPTLSAKERALISTAEKQIQLEFQTSGKRRFLDIADDAYRALMNSSTQNVNKVGADGKGAYGMQIDWDIGSQANIAVTPESSPRGAEATKDGLFTDILAEYEIYPGENAVVEYVRVHGKTYAVTANAVTGVNFVLNEAGENIGTLERRLRKPDEIKATTTNELREIRDEMFVQLGLQQVQARIDSILRTSATNHYLLLQNSIGNVPVSKSGDIYYINGQEISAYFSSGDPQKKALESMARSEIETVENKSMDLYNLNEYAGIVEALNLDNPKKATLKWRDHHDHPVRDEYREIEVNLMGDTPEVVFLKRDKKIKRKKGTKSPPMKYSFLAYTSSLIPDGAPYALSSLEPTKFRTIPGITPEKAEQIENAYIAAWNLALVSIDKVKYVPNRRIATNGGSTVYECGVQDGQFLIWKNGAKQDGSLTLMQDYKTGEIDIDTLRSIEAELGYSYLQSIQQELHPST